MDSFDDLNAIAVFDAVGARRLRSEPLSKVVVDAEREIARLRARQLAAVRELSMRQFDTATGHRSLKDWVAATADVAPETAGTIARSAVEMDRHPDVREALREGEISFDRAAALLRVPELGARVDDYARHDIAGIRKSIARHRRMTRTDEQEAFVDRYLALQPTLDESSWRGCFQLSGIQGRILENALHDRGDEYPTHLPDGQRLTRTQRSADALVAMAQDSLGRGADAEAPSSSQVTVFVDATVEPSGDEAGAQVEYGPRVGPEALEAILCSGSVQVIGLHEGRPVAASDSTKAIPAAIRRFVAWRDSGCTADSCPSRYRLEPHHVIPRARGGGNDPDNLTTLCWHHHHIVVHGHGFQIDPDSPPGRRRFTRSSGRRAPPVHS